MSAVPDIDVPEFANTEDANTDMAKEKKQTEKNRLQEKIISSGNSEIDRKMGGGIPAGSLCLMEGVNDSGKSVLVQQILWGAMQQNRTVLTFTTENTIRSLLKQMESLSLDISDYFIIGNSTIFPIHEKLIESKGKTAENLLKLMLRSLSSCKEDIIIIDSLTIFVVNSTEHEILNFFAECKKLSDKGKTILITVHSYAFSEMLLIRIRSICDTHLHLKIEQVGDQLVKTIEVAKIRGAQKTTGNIISFDVEPGFGLRIIPVSRAKA